MQDPEKIAKEIFSAFSSVQYPGDLCLRRSSEGDEPFLLEAEFKGKNDWRVLEPEFLDQAPDGLSSALSFFSHEAFHFYLPAYLLADIQGRLEDTTPVFYLTHGFDDSSRSQILNLGRYGQTTWFDEASKRFAAFSPQQARAIVAYLLLKRQSDSWECERIDQSLKNYWNEKAT
jgi:hypothetical protein